MQSPIEFIPWQHYKFLKPRPNNGSALVLIVDTFITGNPKTDTVTIMDVRHYQPGEQRVFKTVPALDFFTLIEDKKIVEPYVPKV